MAPDQQDYFEDDIPPTMSAVDIADWRLRTFALYDKVRQLAATNRSTRMSSGGRNGT